MNARADPLALPPVPPPAPSAHPWRDGAVVLLFAAMLGLPGLVLPGLAWMGIELPGMERLKSHPTLEFENRRAAPWPAPALRRTLAAEFERAFSDRFYARGLLLFIHHATLVDRFGVSPTPTVMLGRDGWLYFLGEDARSLERHHRGTLPISDGDIAAVAGELQRRARFLAAHGIAYLAVIVPEKYTIYPEHLPAWVVRSPSPLPFERLANAIEAQKDVRFVDLREPLRAAKAKERLYYMTDSHWNLAGASVGYAAIMQAVQAALGEARLPEIAAPPRPPHVPETDFYSGDLARSVGLLWHLKEPDVLSLGKVFADTTSCCAKRIDAGTDEGIEIYACERPGLPRAVVLRDSMAIPLIPLLSENFSRVVYLGTQQLDPALILREKPDIVIDEMVERSLLSPAAHPMPP